ncbi:MAG: 50S ribosomal protein L10 [Oscillospiraceae bacterium]|nr:50S ribosomal protein L10 [Oscillospiraceae bacterium]
MANATVISEKAAVVDALKERLGNAQVGVLVDYGGLTVAQDTELRNELRKNGVEYGVVKNTMVRRALDSVGLEALDGVLHGSTSLATASDDPIIPIRLLADYSKKMGEKFNIKAAFVEGKVLSEGEIAQLATMTSKKDLYAQLVGTLMAPMANLAAVVNAIAEKGEAAE